MLEVMFLSVSTDGGMDSFIQLKLTHQVDLAFRAEERRGGRRSDGTDGQRQISVTHCFNVLLKC